MFKVFTVEGWFDIPDAIASSSSPGAAISIRAFFVFAVATGGLLGLSMANAVFVDEMVKDNNEELEANILLLKQEIMELRSQNRSEYQQLLSKLDTLHPAVEQSSEESDSE